MANAPAPIGIAPRQAKPAAFTGTDIAWRVLCDLYPSAETPEIILAVVEYCAARKLDPLRKPVHIVPMWNAKLRRRVQVVMQGINEIETTAHRTGKWAGMDDPRWGPEETKTFRGEAENDDGSKRSVEVTITFPLWCAVTVWRIVDGEKRAFSEPVFWIEAYGHAGFRSEVPNARWTQAPRQMLHKCAKSASLRAAFPEETSGYSAEEMEDRDVDTGGVTIDGVADHGDPGLTDRDRQIGTTPSSGAADRPSLGLDEPNGTLWLKNLDGLLHRVAGEQEVVELRDDDRVKRVLARKETPSLIKARIEDMFRDAFARVRTTADEAPGAPSWPDDPVDRIVAEIESMDGRALDALPSDATWRARVHAATAGFPPDEERINEAVVSRRASLRVGQQGR
jgi:phage recombination protein Bet